MSYLFDRTAGTELRQWNVFPINFRIGLTNNIEFDLAYQDYIHLRVRDGQGGGTETRSGFGDLTLQGKINLYGNDGGKVAFGLIPFLKIPTNTHDLWNDSLEGGLSIPFQAALPGGFGLGLQSGASFIRNGNDTGYDASFFNAILLSHALFIDRLSAYGEFYDVVSTGAGDTHAAFVDFGLVYQIAPNAEVDIGCNFGVSEAAPDYQPFVGFGFRF